MLHEVRPHLGRGARVVDAARLQQHVLPVDGDGAPVEADVVRPAAHLIEGSAVVDIVVSEDGRGGISAAGGEEGQCQSGERQGGAKHGER